MATIKLGNIVKTYRKGDVPTIKSISLDIKDKEFVVLVGPSGCGKSTLMRMIAGLEEISSGDMHFGDLRVNELSPKERNIAMVFQNYALYPHMTVFDNIAFSFKLQKTPKDEIQRKVTEAARILGIEHLLDRTPREMSGGQRQRVAIGRAIVRNPDVFLFDEPLSNLDASLRVQMRTEIKKLHKQLNATMVYVTHDQIEAMTMGDRIVVLKAGIVQQFDTPMNLFHEPVNKFVAGFIGSPAMNFLDGEIILEDKLKFRSKDVKFGVPDALVEKLKGNVGKEVTYGFRPEYIYDKNYEKVRWLSEDVAVMIDNVEPTGSETFNYFHFVGNPAQTYCFRTNSEQDYKIGDIIRIGVDIERLRFFDKETEARIA